MRLQFSTPECGRIIAFSPKASRHSPETQCSLLLGRSILGLPVVSQATPCKSNSTFCVCKIQSAFHFWSVKSYSVFTNSLVKYALVHMCMSQPDSQAPRGIGLGSRNMACVQCNLAVVTLASSPEKLGKGPGRTCKTFSTMFTQFKMLTSSY